MAAIAVSLGSLIVGFSSGYTSPALPSMKEANTTSFTLNESQVSLAGWSTQNRSNPDERL